MQEIRQDNLNFEITRVLSATHKELGKTMSTTSNLDPIWSDFLNTLNAEFDESGKISTFGLAELERFLIKNGPVLTSLTHQALVKVTGSEAKSFLQGQLTNDLNDVSETQAQFSAYCDPQGNVLANFLVFLYQDNYYLSFDDSVGEAILKRLQMFIMRADVQVEDVSDQLIHIGFAGEFGDLDVQRRLSTKVKETFECGMIGVEEMKDILVVKVPGPYHKYSLFGPATQMMEAWKSIKNNSDLTNNHDWQLLDIAAGVPTITSEVSGKFVAQFFNLDKFDAINFKKGCFPGQEVIARMHYRGKVTKRMLRLHLDEAADFTAGDQLMLTDSNDRSHKMTVINSRPDVLNGTLCLAITSLKPLESVEGDLTTETGGKVSIEPLPYQLTEEE